MTTIIVCTSLSELLIRITIRELMRDSNTIVVSTSPQISQALAPYNIFPITIIPAQNAQFDWGSRDSFFRKIFLEGEQLKCCFPDTELPVWKVVSLDRFSFWFTNKDSAELYDVITALKWDRAIVSADLHSDVVWTLARYSGKPVWGVKVSSFRTREWYDLGTIDNIPFAGIYVSSEADRAFLLKIAQVVTEVVTD